MFPKTPIDISCPWKILNEITLVSKWFIINDPLLAFTSDYGFINGKMCQT